MTRFVLFCFFGISIFNFVASPQSIYLLEKQYDEIKSVVEIETASLDSLKNILENRAKQIESEKQKQNPDNDKIVKLMAGSVTLFNTIDNKQEKLDERILQLKKLGRILVEKYSAQIDSLNLLKKTSKENARDLDSEILFYTEKRLLVSPQIEILSFNPKKILEIDLSKTKNNVERESLSEYLFTALTEVSAVLSDVTKQSKEVNDALTLQKKTSKFLAETEFDRDFRLGNISRSSAERNDVNASFGGENKFRIADQINSYALLLDQLKIFDKSESINSQKFIYKHGEENFSLKDYSELLKEVKQKLSDYKLVLTNKIEQSK